MKLACSTVLFNQLDLYGTLQHLAWAGYDGAELACLKSHARHIEPNTNKAYIAEIKSTAKKHGIELLAIHLDAEGNTHEEKIKYVTKMFDVAEKLSIPIIAIPAGGKTGDKEITKQEFNYIGKLCEQAESRGLTLAIKYHKGASIYNLATQIQLFNVVKSPALGVNLDPREIYKAGEDNSEVIGNLGKKIVHTHIRDYPSPDQDGATPEEQIMGRGNIDYTQILRDLKKVGYDKALSLVMVGAFTYPLSKQMGIAAECRGYLNRCLQTLK
jgi:sugar phosphate isomerase/epimerase